MKKIRFKKNLEKKKSILKKKKLNVKNLTL